MAAPDRPDPDDIVASNWGQWVHDHQAAPRRFMAWRAASATLGVDGLNDVTFDNKDDPAGMMPDLVNFRAPTAGVVAFAAGVNFSFAGTSTPLCIVSLVEDGAEVRRGHQINTTGVNWTNPAVSLIVAAVMPVKANSNYKVQLYLSAAGITKTLQGGKALTWFEGCYLTAPV